MSIAALVALVAAAVLGSPTTAAPPSFAISSASDDAIVIPVPVVAPAPIPASPTPSTAPTAPTTKPAAPVVIPKVPLKNLIACGQSFACAQRAAKACRSASYRLITPPVDIFGAMLTATRQITIRGVTPDKRCVVDEQQVKTTLTLSSKLIARAKAEGRSMMDIRKEEADMRKEAQALDGKKGSCIFATAKDVVQYLTDLKNMEWSSGPPRGARCIGPLH